MAGETRFSVDPTEFADKRVLITGGTKGMGEAVVRRFQSSGASIATTARSSLPHGQAPDLFVQADIGTVSGVQQVVDRVQHEWGRLDILVNNVGGTATKPGEFEALSGRLAEHPEHQFARGRPTGPRLHPRHDRTTVGRRDSHLAHLPSHAILQFHARLCGGQGCLSTYSKGLAKGVAPDGVRVTMISPGFIETSGTHVMIMDIAQNERINEEAARQWIIDMLRGIPVGRPGCRTRWRSWSPFSRPIGQRSSAAPTTSWTAGRLP